MFKNSLLIPDCKSVKSRTLLFIILHCRYVQSTFEATPFSGHFTDAKYIFISDAILFMTSSRFMMSPKRASFSDNNEGVTSDFRRNKQLKLQCCTLFTHKNIGNTVMNTSMPVSYKMLYSTFHHTEYVKSMNPNYLIA